MPRALTEQEKRRHRQKLLEKGQAVVLSQGIRRVSVDEIAKAAGMAKGSFYQHFDSKEQYLFALINDIHGKAFAQAERIILNENDLRTNIRDFLVTLFNVPEMVFLMKNFHDISELLESSPNREPLCAKQTEADMFKKLLLLAGTDTQKVSPGVVYNYIHALYLMMGSDLMLSEALPETFELMKDGLIDYIFGGI